MAESEETSRSAVAPDHADSALPKVSITLSDKEIQSILEIDNQKSPNKSTRKGLVEAVDVSMYESSAQQVTFLYHTNDSMHGFQSSMQHIISLPVTCQISHVNGMDQNQQEMKMGNLIR